MDEINKLKFELQALLDEDKRLALELTKLNDRLHTITDRLSILRDNYGRHGLIRQTRTLLEKAEAVKRDAALPRVLWQREPKYGEKELVLIKVTPKRLHVRRIGSPSCEQYDRVTGSKPGRVNDEFCGIIDVAKTLARGDVVL